MKSLRCIAVALLLAFVCGPALIDPCLFDCHDATAARSGVPHCHDAAAHDGTALTGASSCDHDHGALSADAVDVRAAASHHIGTLSLAPEPHQPLATEPAALFVRAQGAAPPRRPSLHSRDLPLRL